jgi:Cu-processing system permease protein
MNLHGSGVGSGSLGRIRVVAENTFLESVRDRTLTVPVILAVIMIGAGLFTRTLSLGQHGKLLQDFGLASVCFFSDVLVILAVTTTLARGVGQGTVLHILSKPVRRGELILGKYGGVLGVVLLNVLVILGGLHLALLLVKAGGSVGVLWAVGLAIVEVMVVGALSVFFSVVSSPVLAMIFSGFGVLIGHATADIRELASRLGSESARAMGECLYYILPNLEIFNVRAAAVHGYPIEVGYVALALVYGILYATVVLFAAIWIFERRDLV